MTPNPNLMGAVRTERVKRAMFGLLGPLGPLCNPVRLAEELAKLDAMCGGRLVVLFLRGTPNEHHTYDTPGEKTRVMRQEGIDLILKAGQEDEPFAWKGENYDFSTISIWPRVMQKPHPIVYGSGNSEESIRFAATRRLGIAFSFALPEAVQKWLEMYRREAAKEGWELTPELVMYRGLSYIAETDEQAEDEMGAFFGDKDDVLANLRSETMGRSE